jgi:hypothetical protein
MRKTLIQNNIYDERAVMEIWDLYDKNRNYLGKAKNEAINLKKMIIILSSMYAYSILVTKCLFSKDRLTKKAGPACGM